MTPVTIAAHVAEACGPLNDTECERARLLAIEFQIGAVAESYAEADSARFTEGGSEAASRVLEALKRNPDLSERDLVETLRVTRHAVQRARRVWGKPLKAAKRHRSFSPMTERTLAELRRNPQLAKLSTNAIARRLSVCWDTVARARKRIANENLTNDESVSECEAQIENV